MQLVDQDTQPVILTKPAVAKDIALGRQFKRSAAWEDGDTSIFCDAYAYVTGVRARRNDDGSITLLEQVTPFEVFAENEYLQPIERAIFLWQRWRKDDKGSWVRDYDADYSNEVGLVYSHDLKAAESQCELFIKNLDFTSQFDPSAWN